MSEREFAHYDVAVQQVWSDCALNTLALQILISNKDTHGCKEDTGKER